MDDIVTTDARQVRRIRIQLGQNLHDVGRIERYVNDRVGPIKLLGEGIQVGRFANHHRAGGGALVEAPRHLVAAASVPGLVDASAVGEKIAGVLQHDGQVQPMLAGVLDAKGALLLINAAGGDGVVTVKQLSLARRAQQCPVGDRGAPADVVDIDYACRELRHRGEAQYVY